MKESDFVSRFISELRKKTKLWELNIHGHNMQRYSIDHILCINGRMLGIEFKVQRHNKIKITPMQIRELNNIKHNGEGVSLVIAYDENRDEILYRIKDLDPRDAMLAEKITIDWDELFLKYEPAIDYLLGMLQ